jgi:type VI secretion system protein ImpG
MDERLLTYYSGELRYVREMAAEFAREFPKIGARLALDRDAKDICPDPYVERLLEGFAFLAARLHLKLDEEFPRLTHSFLGRIFPLCLSPVPSIGVVCFQPDPLEPIPPEGFLVSRGSVLRSRGEEAVCQFRTAHDFRLWPLKIIDSSYYTRSVVELDLPGSLDLKAAISIRLQTTGETTFRELKIDRLPFFINGDGHVPFAIYEQIFAQSACVILQSSKGQGSTRKILPASTIREVGFQDVEALLPLTLTGFEGYRLLKEYFACPHRYLFFELTGLASTMAQFNGDQLEIIFGLRTADPKLDDRVDKHSFSLFCTPVINLFEKKLDPILISERVTEFQIVPDATQPLDYEVYEIEEVVGIMEKANEVRRFEPVSLVGDRTDRLGGYYRVNRVPKVVSANDKEGTQHYSGSDVYVSLIDSKVAPYTEPMTQLNIRTLCTNRHLPIKVSASASDTGLATELFSPASLIHWVAGPTMPLPSIVEGDPAWRAISHLSLNYASLLDSNSEGAMGLRELLKVFIDPGNTQTARQIDGIQSMASVPIIRRAILDGSVTFIRGLEIRITIDESVFEEVGAFLFGSLVSRFFARYVSTNSCTETVLVSAQRGEVMRWGTQSGKRLVV